MGKLLTFEHADLFRFLAKLKSDSAAAFITDPPYCSVGSASQSTTTKYVTGPSVKNLGTPFVGDTRDARSWLRWTTMWLDEAHRVTREGGVLCMFTDWRMLPLATDAVQAAGWVWCGIVPWDKSRGVRPRLGGFRSQCEYIVWASKGRLVGNPDLTLDGYYYGQRTREERQYHQVGKPLALMRQIVQVAPPGDLIVDPFSGGGTTGAAALLEGRRFAGCEKGVHQFRTARERLNATLREIRRAA